MFVEYKKHFFLIFIFWPKSRERQNRTSKKKLTHGRQFISDRQVRNEKIKWYLKKEGCLRDNLPHLKKKIFKKCRAFEKFIEKMAYFPAVFWINKILNLYL